MTEAAKDLVDLFLLTIEFALIVWAILKTIEDNGKDDE